MRAWWFLAEDFVVWWPQCLGLTRTPGVFHVTVPTKTYKQEFSVVSSASCVDIPTFSTGTDVCIAVAYSSRPPVSFHILIFS